MSPQNAIPLSDEYFREKAHEWVSTHGLEEKYLHSLYIAFKEVSRDTRHACAEAVLTLRNPHPGDLIYGGGYADCRNKAHAACMNAGGKL